jgi:hypothetical protein
MWSLFAARTADNPGPGVPGIPVWEVAGLPAFPWPEGAQLTGHFAVTATPSACNFLQYEPGELTWWGEPDEAGWKYALAAHRMGLEP